MKITVQVSLSVYGSEEYLDGFSIISAGSHLPADIASAILPEAFLKSRAVSRAEEAALFACCEMCIKIMLQISETDEMIKGILTNHNTGIMITP